MGMKVIGLDGQTHQWKPELYHSQRSNASKPHTRARDLLRTLFPFYSINEEVLLVGVPTRLYIDLYIHPLRLAVEVNGIQHYDGTSFFHANRQCFRDSLKRDQMKREWCSLNNIDLIELRDGDNLEKWTEQIRNR